MQHCPSDLTPTLLWGLEVALEAKPYALSLAGPFTSAGRRYANVDFYATTTQMRSNLPTYCSAQARCKGISNSALGRHGTTGSINQAEEEGRGLQVGGRGVGGGRQREVLGRPQPLPILPCAPLATLPLLGRGRRRPLQEGRRRRPRRRWWRRDLEFPSAAAVAAAAPKPRERPPPGALVAFEGGSCGSGAFHCPSYGNFPAATHRARDQAEASRGEQSTRSPTPPPPLRLPTSKCVPPPWTPKVLPNTSQRPLGMPGNKNLQDPLDPITTHPCHPARAPFHVPCHFHQLHSRERTGSFTVHNNSPLPHYSPLTPTLPTPSQTLPRPSKPRC